MSKLNPDALCITELALLERELPLYNITGYKLVSSYSRPELHNRGGGAAIFIKDDPKLKVTKLAFNIQPHCKIFEITGVLIKKDGRRYTLLNIYRPPSSNSDDLELFFEALELTLTNVHSAYNDKTNIILTGDLNICQITRSVNRVRLNNIARRFNLHSCINEPTRITHHSASALDVIFTNIPSHLYKAKTHDTIISDHKGISIDIMAFNHVKIGETLELKRTITNATRKLFNEYLSRETWAIALSKATPSEAYDSFIEKYTAIYSVCFPYKLHKRGVWQPPSAQWTDELLTLRTLASSLNTAYQASGLQVDKNRFTEANEAYKKAVNKHKGNVQRQYIESKANKAKASWQILNFERGVEVTKARDNIVLKNETCPKRIADTFNTFFIEKPALIKDSIETNSFPSIPKSKIFDPPVTHSLFLNPISIQEVTEHIKSLKNSAALGPDLTSNNILREHANNLAPVLAHITNLSFLTGEFPKALKNSKISPLYKKGDMNEVNNYRPLALISAISKVLEKAFRARLIEHLEGHNVLSPSQYGYRQNKNTTKCIIDAVNKILLSYDSKHTTYSSYVDLSAAFDCVDISLL